MEINIKGTQDNYEGVLLGNKCFYTGDPVRDFRQALVYAANDFDGIILYGRSVVEFVESGSLYRLDSNKHIAKSIGNIVAN